MEVWLLWGKRPATRAAEETPYDTGWQAVTQTPSPAN